MEQGTAVSGERSDCLQVAFDTLRRLGDAQVARVFGGEADLAAANAAVFADAIVTHATLSRIAAEVPPEMAELRSAIATASGLVLDLVAAGLTDLGVGEATDRERVDGDSLLAIGRYVAALRTLQAVNDLPGE